MDKKPVFSYMEADYLDIGTSEVPDVQFMEFFTKHNENPHAQTSERQYVPHKNTTTLTTGYQTQFPIVMDEYMHDAVCEFIRDVAEEQKLGVNCPYYKVRLHQPVEGMDNTFYCRKFIVGFAIDSIVREGGRIKAIEGNMNALGDVVVGKFNTNTLTFVAE